MEFGLVIMGLGVLVAALGALLLLRANAIFKLPQYKGVVGHVLELSRNKTKIKVPVVQIERDGTVYAHQAAAVNGMLGYHEGQKVTVRFDAKHPDKLYLEEDCTKRGTAVKTLIVGIAILVIGVVLLLVSVL